AWQGPMAPAAGIVAMAYAVEMFWAIALEAEILARAVRLDAGDGHADAVRHHAMAAQAETILLMMAALDGRTEETKP
ncbi:MAG: hypothetical protein WAT70_08020, partial [Rhizobiaceae bacterium]